MRQRNIMKNAGSNSPGQTTQDATELEMGLGLGLGLGKGETQVNTDNVDVFEVPRSQDGIPSIATGDRLATPAVPPPVAASIPPKRGAE